MCGFFYSSAFSACFGGELRYRLQGRLGLEGVLAVNGWSGADKGLGFCRS